MAAQTKQSGTHLTGPLRLTTGSGVNRVAGRSASVTVAALTTNTAESYSITDADAVAGDVVIISPRTAPEVGWAVEYANCITDGTIVVRARNHSGSTLTGGALVLGYQILK